MAKLYRIRKPDGQLSPYWHASITIPGPTGTPIRQRRSTRAKEKAKAAQVASAWEHANHLGRAGQLSADRARQLIEETFTLATGEVLQQETIQSWLESWLEAKSLGIAPSSLKRYSGVVKDFLHYLKDDKKLPLQRLTPRALIEFRTQLSGTGKANHSINLDMKVLAMALRSAVDGGTISRNPCDSIDMLPNDSESKQPFTMDQIRTILNAAQGEWKGMVILAYTTGARLGDVATMRWENVLMEQRVLRFLPRKTRRTSRAKPLSIPMHPDLITYLDSLPRPHSPKAFIHPSLGRTVDEKGTGGKQGLSCEFGRLLERAGIDREIQRSSADVKSKRKGARSKSRYSFHSFRHTVASVMHNAGVAAELRQQITGHASAEVHQIYTHTEMETLRGAILKIPELEGV